MGTVRVLIVRVRPLLRRIREILCNEGDGWVKKRKPSGSRSNRSESLGVHRKSGHGVAADKNDQKRSTKQRERLTLPSCRLDHAHSMQKSGETCLPIQAAYVSRRRRRLCCLSEDRAAPAYQVASAALRMVGTVRRRMRMGGPVCRK